MAIEFIGASTGGTTSAGTMPAYEAGDLLIAFSFRDGSTSPVAIPTANGWEVLHNGFGANSCGHVVAYMIAPDTSVVTSGFTNASSTVILVFRGIDPANPIGDSQPNGGLGTTITYPALTMQVTDGSSWVAAFAGHRSTNTALSTTFDSFANRAFVEDSTDDIAAFDSNGGRSSFSAQNVSVGGTSSGWRSHTLEIRAAVTAVDVNADLSQTLGGVTTAAAAEALVEGATSRTLGSISLEATGAQLIETFAEVSVNLGPVSLSAAAEAAVSAAASGTLGPVTAESDADNPVEGALGKALGDIVAESAAESPVDAAVSATLGPTTVAATGSSESGALASLSKSLESVSASAQAEAPVTADFAQNLGDITAVSSASGEAEEAQAELAVSLGSVTAEAEGRTETRAAVTETLGGVTLDARGAENAPAADGRPAIRLGDAWQRKPAKVLIAGEFIEKPMKRFDGTAWRLV